MPGFEVTKVEEKMGLKAYESCSLTLNDCRVENVHLLGGEEYYEKQAGFKGAMSAFNSSRALVAVMAIGVGRAAWDYARNFMKENYDLSRPIPRYRRMEEQLADAKRKLDVGRLLAWRGAALLDYGESNALQASMAKAYCPPVALDACRTAVDVLADAGVRNDYFVEKLYRDVKAMDIVEGTQQMQRTVIARRLVNLPNYREAQS
jgi:acyl-CoA dehydrogenase